MVILHKQENNIEVWRPSVSLLRAIFTETPKYEMCPEGQVQPKLDHITGRVHNTAILVLVSSTH